MKNLKRSLKRAYKHCSGTLLIIGVSVVLQVLQDFYPQFLEYQAFSPLQGCWCLISLFLHMVSHAGWSHLMGNFMFSLPFMLYLERGLGKNRFLQFYMLCGLAGAGVHLLAMGTSQGVIGSSAALFGVMAGACLAYGKTLSEQLLGLLVLGLFLVPQLISIPELTMLQVAVFGHLGGGGMGMALSSRLYSVHRKV